MTKLFESQSPSLIDVGVENGGFGGNMGAGDLEESEIVEVDPSLMFQNWRKKFC